MHRNRIRRKSFRFGKKPNKAPFENKQRPRENIALQNIHEIIAHVVCRAPKRFEPKFLNGRKFLAQAISGRKNMNVIESRDRPNLHWRNHLRRISQAIAIIAMIYMTLTGDASRTSIIINFFAGREIVG